MKQSLLDFLQSASNMAASAVSGPVDLIGSGLGMAGVNVGAAPVGGTEWMKRQGLMRDVPQGPARVLGETAGLLGPALATQFAPQIARGLLQVEANAMKPRTLNKEAGAIVWHGSPHKFDKFDASKIGTGEGAQAYGHGLYLAESDDVAKTYQSKLTDPAFKYSAMNDAKARLNEKIAKRVEAADPARAAALRAEVASLAEPGGALYKVDLPDEHIAKMLDWDKPLSQQEHIQRALLNQDDGWKSYASQMDAESRALAEDMVLGKKPVYDGAEDFWSSLLSKHPKLDHNEIHDTRWRLNPQTDDVEWLTGVLNGNSAIGSGVRGGGGADLYNSFGGGAEAANKLRELGIPGIRYLDGGSRGAGNGTSNFVVFPGNEGLLSILERNGVPLK